MSWIVFFRKFRNVLSQWRQAHSFGRTSQPMVFPKELLSRREPLGECCEQLARWYLESTVGMRFIEKNARPQINGLRGSISGELDLVMEMPDANRTLVFVEVRSRADLWTFYGTPAQSISFKKKQKVCHAARCWLLQKKISALHPVRFDVISVVWPPDQEPQISYFPNAFSWQESAWQRQGKVY